MSTLRHLAVPVLAACVYLATLAGVRAHSQQLLGTASPPAPVLSPAPIEASKPFTEPELLGVYRSNGRFKALSKLGAFADTRVGQAPQGQPAPHRPDVPGWIDLRDHYEGVVEDYALPAQARKSLKGLSSAAALLESIVAFVYGREPILRTPTHVALDSEQGLIVSDPAAVAIHVLSGESRFRIVGGPERHLLQPNGIAVDAEDRIYVADGQRGMILVYDREGHFLRFLGAFRGESMFQSPAGIAIDRRAGHLYVLDSPANELTVLDLEGNVLRRAGGLRKSSGVNFDYPTEIALHKNAVIVLDRFGARLQVLDLMCKPVHEIQLHPYTGPTRPIEMGLAVDNEGRIYLSNTGSGAPIKVYTQSGRLLAAFGRAGTRNREFNAPSGLWIGPDDRLYVADTFNQRIQVFQGLRLVAGPDTDALPASLDRSGLAPGRPH